MNEQLPTTTSDDQSGIDRRKFLLRTTALTAGAWAAPSILTIDRAFGASGSPCPCGEGTQTDAATVKGTVALLGQVPIAVRENACLNDDAPGTTVGLPGGLGHVTLASVACEECGSSVVTGAVLLTIPGLPAIAADALHSNAHCCKGTPEGGSKVVGLTVDGTTVAESTSEQVIPIAFGSVTLNEKPTSPHGTAGEFNALHIVYNDPLGDSIDLKMASSKVTCA